MLSLCVRSCRALVSVPPVSHLASYIGARRAWSDAPRRTRRNSAPPTASMPWSHINGLFSVCKPRGVTSAAVINELKHMLMRPTPEELERQPTLYIKQQRVAGQQRFIRIGHGGTLDALASGVLVVGVGSGTKELTKLLASEKVYYARCILGISTETHDLDITSNVVWTDRPYGHVTREALEEFLNTRYSARTGGVIQQTPPIYSALKQNGVRLSELARTGQVDESDAATKTRDVEVHSIKVTEFNLPYYSLEIVCGSGFYVRSCVRDIGQHFDCGSTTISLVRTKQSGFQLDVMNDAQMQHIDITNPEERRLRSEQYVIGIDVERIRFRRNDRRVDSHAKSSAASSRSNSVSEDDTAGNADNRSVPIAIPSDILATASASAYVPSIPYLECTKENVLRVLSVPQQFRRTPLSSMRAEETLCNDAAASRSTSSS